MFSVSISGLTKMRDIVKDTNEAVLLQKIEAVKSQISGDPVSLYA